MDYNKFAKRQQQLFLAGASRIASYYAQWDHLEKNIRNLYVGLSDELEKNFENNSSRLISSKDMKKQSVYPFLQLRICVPSFAGKTSIVSPDVAILFVQGTYGEVLVMFHSGNTGKLGLKGKHFLYNVYSNPDELSVKKLEKIISCYFSYLAKLTYLNEPSFWSWLSSIWLPFNASRKLLKYGKSTLKAVKSSVELLAKYNQ